MHKKNYDFQFQRSYSILNQIRHDGSKIYNDCIKSSWFPFPFQLSFSDKKINPIRMSSYNPTVSISKNHQKKIIKNLHWLPYRKSYKATCINKKPACLENSWLQKGDLLIDGSTSVNGELALGSNLFSIYMPWEGYNFEDAILISDRTAQAYTNIYIEEFFAKISKNELMDSIIKPKTWVNQGDILVSKRRESKNPRLMERLVIGLTELSKDPNREIVKQNSDRFPIDTSFKAGESTFGWVISVKQSESEIEAFSNSRVESAKTDNTNQKDEKKKIFTPHPGDLINGSPGQGFKNFSPSYIFILPFASLFQNNQNYKLNNLFLTWSVIVPQKNNATSPKKKIKFSQYRFPITTLSFPFLKSFFSLKNFFFFKFNNNKKQFIFKKTLFNLNSVLFNQNNRNPFSDDLFRVLLDKQINLTPQKQKPKSDSSSFKPMTKIKKLNSKTLKQNEEKRISMEKVIYIAITKQLQIGDKMSGRHGNKGVVSKILPFYDMPYLIDGTPIDIVLNPLGVPSRMNVGQLFESLLGLSGFFRHEYYRIPPFDENYGYQFSRNFVYWKLNELNQQHYNSYFSSSLKPHIRKKRLDNFSITQNLFSERGENAYSAQLPTSTLERTSQVPQMKKWSLTVPSHVFHRYSFFTPHPGNLINGSPGRGFKKIFSRKKFEKNFQLLKNIKILSKICENFEWTAHEKPATNIGITINTGNIEAITPIKLNPKFAEKFSFFFQGKKKNIKSLTRLKIGLNPNFPGKIRLIDGRTGETFYRPVIVGKSYMLKLNHLVDSKIHARTTGPYALITQQPLKGKRNQGGQRIGEMEVWSFYAFGSASLLLEMLTIKSDDFVGRKNLIREIAGPPKQESFDRDVPESFKVLMMSLRTLCLDLTVFRDEPDNLNKNFPKHLKPKKIDRNKERLKSLL